MGRWEPKAGREERDRKVIKLYQQGISIPKLLLRFGNIGIYAILRKHGQNQCCLYSHEEGNYSMKVKHKRSQLIGTSSKFNVHGMSEIIVGFDCGDMDSDYIKDYLVYLPALGQWKDMAQAFKDCDLITDNYNTRFFEPKSEEDRTRGFTP